MTPAMNVSSDRVLPLKAFFWSSIIVLYTDTNLARFRACVFVAWKMCCARDCQLRQQAHGSAQHEV